MAYQSFSVKLAVPIWRKVRERDGTIRLEDDWLPYALRGSSPVEVLHMIEDMLSGYVKAGSYRRAKKR